MFPFCVERGARLFSLDFPGFYRRCRVTCAHISLCGAVSAAFLSLVFVEELV